ncbi:MAG: porin family protein [Planctomycetes bacterium]|nr:porin family protein [Planctomycetota bacterium]
MNGMILMAFTLSAPFQEGARSVDGEAFLHPISPSYTLSRGFVMAPEADPSWRLAAPPRFTDIDDDEAQQDRGTFWSLGPRIGFLKARDADRGTWLGGAQLRLHLSPAIALEGAISAHQDRFADGDAIVTFYPVEVSALLYPLPPLGFVGIYGTAGVGWYYSRVDYKGSLSANDDETTSTFAAHLGVGAEIGLGTATSLNADIRYVFLEPDFDALEDEKFDLIQFTAGLNFRL